MRPLRLILIAFLAGASLASPAAAAPLPSEQLAFGAPGSDAAQLTTNLGIAIGTAGLWVVDMGNDRLQLWTPTGSFVRMFGSTGTQRGEFRFPEDVVETGGSVYVSECLNQRVQRFTTEPDHQPTGSFTGDAQGLLCPEGLAATASSGLWVADTFHDRVLRFGPAADTGPVASLSVPRPIDVAVSPATGDLYVVHSPGTTCAGGGVRRYSATGELLGSFAPDVCSHGVNVDAANNVYVTADRQVNVFTAAGTYVGTLPAPTGQQSFGYPAGITSDASCRVFISDRDAGRIFVYGEGPDGGCTTYPATTATLPPPTGTGTTPSALIPTIYATSRVAVRSTGTVAIGRVGCGAVACTVAAQGSVASGAKRRWLTAQPISLMANAKRTLRLRFRSAADRRAVRATIARRGNARLKVDVVARAADGTTRLTTRTVTLR